MRGDVVIVDFRPTNPAAKVRPAVVIQNDRVIGRLSAATIVEIDMRVTKAGMDGGRGQSWGQTPRYDRWPMISRIRSLIGRLRELLNLPARVQTDSKQLARDSRADAG